MKYIFTIAVVMVLGLTPSTTTYEASSFEDLTALPEIVSHETLRSRIDILVDAIQEFEGFYDGSRAEVNNNPCNLRYSPYEASKLAGFAYFNTYEDGRKACVHQITIASDGRSGVYYPDMTLLQFFNVYAPASDSNQPSMYYAFVIKNTEFTSGTRMKDLLE